jgi:hypothetical protein
MFLVVSIGNLLTASGAVRLAALSVDWLSKYFNSLEVFSRYALCLRVKSVSLSGLALLFAFELLLECAMLSRKG